MQTEFPPTNGVVTPGESLPPVLPPAQPGSGRPWPGFVLDILITTVMVVLVTFVGMAAWGVLRAAQLAALGGPNTTDPDALAKAIGEPGMVTLLVVGSVSMLVAAVIVYFWRRRATGAEKTTSWARARQPRVWMQSIALGAGLFAFATALTMALEKLGYAPTPTNQQMLEQALAFSPWLLLGIAVIAAPVSEELLFRRVLFGRFWAAGKPVMGMVVTGLLFGLMHEIPGTGGQPWLPTAILLAFYTAMGVSMAWVYRRTGTLLAPILTHATNNLLACLLMISGYGS